MFPLTVPGKLVVTFISTSAQTSSSAACHSVLDIIIAGVYIFPPRWLHNLQSVQSDGSPVGRNENLQTIVASWEPVPHMGLVAQVRLNTALWFSGFLLTAKFSLKLYSKDPIKTWCFIPLSWAFSFRGMTWVSFQCNPEKCYSTQEKWYPCDTGNGFQCVIVCQDKTLRLASI